MGRKGGREGGRVVKLGNADCFEDGEVGPDYMRGWGSEWGSDGRGRLGDVQ